MEYLLHFTAIAVLLGLIIYVCVLFTNAVENFGSEYGLQDGAVGGILAAIGTALPETIVPLVAIAGTLLTGGNAVEGEDIALGAVLGAPFLLATGAFFVTGAAVLIFSKTRKQNGMNFGEMCSNPMILIRDLKFFACSYTIAVLTAFIPYKPLKYLIALGLLAYYFIYAKRTLKKDFGVCVAEGECSEPEALSLSKLLNIPAKYTKPAIWIQILLSLAGLVVLAHLFVNEIKYFAGVLNIHPLVMSLLLAPIATELPECFNSAIWIKAGKDSLSISNISGALVFQSCIPAAIGIALTPWKFTEPAVVSVVLVYLSLVILYVRAMRNGGRVNMQILLLCGFFYLIYIAYVLKMLI